MGKFNEKDEWIMNISYLRGYLAKQSDAEKFLRSVCNLIERQLKEWDPVYRLVLSQDTLKKRHFNIQVSNKKQTYDIGIHLNQVKMLKTKGNVALDKFIWTELLRLDLQLGKITGNYLPLVLNLK